MAVTPVLLSCPQPHWLQRCRQFGVTYVPHCNPMEKKTPHTPPTHTHTDHIFWPHAELDAAAAVIMRPGSPLQHPCTAHVHLEQAGSPVWKPRGPQSQLAHHPTQTASAPHPRTATPRFRFTAHTCTQGHASGARWPCGANARIGSVVRPFPAELQAPQCGPVAIFAFWPPPTFALFGPCASPCSPHTCRDPSICCGTAAHARCGAPRAFSAHRAHSGPSCGRFSILHPTRTTPFAHFLASPRSQQSFAPALQWLAYAVSGRCGAARAV